MSSAVTPEQPSPRRLRSRTKPRPVVPARAENHLPVQTIERTKPSPVDGKSTAEGVLPIQLAAKHTRLSREDHRLLLRKQDWLQRYDLDLPKDFEKWSSTVDATLVFAQEEAGTAVCISSDGLLITCSHCVAETAEELDRSKSHWLLFKSGRTVEAKCVAWDARRDLALLRVVAAQPDPRSNASLSVVNGASGTGFPHVILAETPPDMDSRLICIGHPGSEDLEASQPGIKTNYDVLHASTGRFRGCAEDQDVQDNSEIGALCHDCWTYWGHSGAPLLQRKTGRLVGLHSSWDDQTGMRRGIHLDALQQFLKEFESQTIELD